MLSINVSPFVSVRLCNILIDVQLGASRTISRSIYRSGRYRVPWFYSSDYPS